MRNIIPSFDSCDDAQPIHRADVFQQASPASSRRSCQTLGDSVDEVTMAEEIDKETNKPHPSATVAESSPAIPPLSKDAWELIQYRLWDQLRSKMWATLTVFLTLVTVGGLLGIPAYIGSRVDQKIADERTKFEKLRAELEADRQKVLTLSSTTSQMAFLWIQSLAEFQRTQLEVLSQLDDPRFKKDERSKQTWHVFRLLVSRFDLQETEKQFRSQIRTLTAILDCSCLPERTEYSDAPLTEADWTAFELSSNKAGLGPRLSQLYAMYSHVLALKAAVLRSHDLGIGMALKDPLRRAALYEQYNASMYPSYRETLNRLFGTFPPPIGRRDSDPWRWLPETAVSAFQQDELRLNAVEDSDAKK